MIVLHISCPRLSDLQFHSFPPLSHRDDSGVIKAPQREGPKAGHTVGSIIMVLKLTLVPLKVLHIIKSNNNFRCCLIKTKQSFSCLLKWLWLFSASGD